MIKKVFINQNFAQLAGAVEYTDCFSARPTIILYMTLNDLMVNFQ